MYFKTMILLSGAFFISCKAGNAPLPGTAKPLDKASEANPYATIEAIPLPEGFERTVYPDTSYQSWIRKRKLKKDKTVYLFDGRLKANQDAQFAVLDISVGLRDLQQCADAVMRIRADFFYQHKKYQQMLFYDNEGNSYAFTAPYTDNHYHEYLDRVFGMCGSASLSRQLQHISDFSSISPGDVLIRGGFPGHAATVMDVAVNEEGKKIYLLSQGYMPAQDIHVLNNPENPSLSPWYEITDLPTIVTPEYVFRKTELMRW